MFPYVCFALLGSAKSHVSTVSAVFNKSTLLWVMTKTKEPRNDTNQRVLLIRYLQSLVLRLCRNSMTFSGQWWTRASRKGPKKWRRARKWPWNGSCTPVYRNNSQSQSVGNFIFIMQKAEVDNGRGRPLSGPPGWNSEYWGVTRGFEPPSPS